MPIRWCLQIEQGDLDFIDPPSERVIYKVTGAFYRDAAPIGSRMLRSHDLPHRSCMWASPMSLTPTSRWRKPSLSATFEPLVDGSNS